MRVYFQSPEGQKGNSGQEASNPRHGSTRVRHGEVQSCPEDRHLRDAFGSLQHSETLHRVRAIQLHQGV